MNLDVVLKLVSAAVGVLPTLVEAGINIYDRVQKIQKLAADGAAGKVTQEQIDEIRAQLDRDLDEFNSPLPPEGA